MISRKKHASPPASNWRPPRITKVREGSPCQGKIERGDLLLEIDGKPPLDILDYLETSEARHLSLHLRRGEKDLLVKARKKSGTPLGLVFDEPVFDGVRMCNNHCVFCFVDQMPYGLRPSLYLKDDDYRLSFYYGNFITLNNLSSKDMERIRSLRLSPLYISLHATDPALRNRIMGGSAEGGLKKLAMLLGYGLELHLQVVVCPGINDGEALRNTLAGVLEKYPAASLAVVPLGLTSRAFELSHDLKPHDRSSALDVLEIIEEFQVKALEIYGRRLFFAADEFYLLGARKFPPDEEYEEYPQLENGVGMARKLIDEVRAGAVKTRSSTCRGVITGVAGEKVLRKALGEAGLGDVELMVLENGVFGKTVTVTALLGGRDIVASLRERPPCAHELLIPASMLRGGRFIDDYSLEDVERETGFRLIEVNVDGTALVRSLCEEG